MSETEPQTTPVVETQQPTEQPQEQQQQEVPAAEVKAEEAPVVVEEVKVAEVVEEVKAEVKAEPTPEPVAAPVVAEEVKVEEPITVVAPATAVVEEEKKEEVVAATTNTGCGCDAGKKCSCVDCKCAGCQCAKEKQGCCAAKKEEEAAVAPVVVEEKKEEAPAPVVEEKKVEAPVVVAAAAAPVVVEEKKAVITPAAAAAPVITPAPVEKKLSAIESAAKWQSDFATRQSSTTTSPSTFTPSSTFATHNSSTTPSPAPVVTKAASTTTTPSYSPASTPTAKPISSNLQQRASVWNNNQPLQAPKQSEFSTHRSGTVTPSSSAARGSVFSYSQAGTLSSTQTQTNAYDKRSAGTTQGSLANLLGSSLNQQAKGTFTGLTRARVDQNEERARMEHSNRGVNTALQAQMKNALNEANEVRSGHRQSTVQSVNYLANKLDKAQGPSSGGSAFAKAKLGPNNTNTDGTAVVGDLVEPTNGR